MIDNINLKCPHCNAPLYLQSSSYLCENNHTYDISREKYVNLLLAQHKRSKNPGDNEDMIKSRQRFLNQGYYKILSDVIVDHVRQSPKSFNQNILDIGCGEGYYMQQLRNASDNSSSCLNLSGLDISKPAVKLAAKRKMDALLSVISAYTLPFFDSKFDSVISVFSPICASETSRVLNDDGQIIMVGPGERHLKGLTNHIYDETVPHEGNYQTLNDATEFKLIEQKEIKDKITVIGTDISDLLTMTPYYWHTSIEKKKALTELKKLDTDIHFYINIYEKNS